VQNALIIQANNFESHINKSSVKTASTELCGYFNTFSFPHIHLVNGQNA